MKNLLLTFLFSCLFLSVFSQIKNDSFENRSESSAALPAAWGIKLIEGYSAGMDDTIYHTGKSSFKIIGKESIKPGAFQSISQLITYEPAGLRQVAVSGYLKTNEVMGSVAFWCQVWDKDNKIIGFQNIQSQQPLINGTGDWEKYQLNLTVPRNTKKLLFGVYLAGTGTVWMDDFKLNEVEVSKIPPSKEVVKFVNDFSTIIKQNSIYKDSLNWTSIDADVKDLSMGLKTVEETKPITAYILQKLRDAGDNHSFFQTKTNAQSYASGNVNPDKVKSKLLDGHIGYLSVPGFGSLDKKTMNDFANEIQEQIKKLDTENALEGWVVDLRTNTGGNMYPMIAGLGPLTGSGILGYFVSDNGEKKKMNPWSYSATKKNNSTMGIDLEHPYFLKNVNAKVAVLVGSSTGSSGEMTTVSFIGKANTKLFGEPTGGFTSANSGFKLSDGSYLYLAVGYVADRNKKEYRSKIIPDVIVKSTAKDDLVLKSATDWLLKK
ncbi:S41 family peptidase [Pedobacter nototheniae]|uniref:S41 family peptidase n=1 Tax=Pedobacter nototheniae TaxID=2488994 RepID=UPI00292FA1DD|nr:S41 family peptidase [Pedobacter nototheniae]